MFGARHSITGGLHNAILKAEEYKCATVRVLKNNQQR
jgi:hypothetical protein